MLQIERMIYEDGFGDGFGKGIGKGALEKLIGQICKKLQKGKSAETIAEELEEDSAVIERIVRAAQKCAPDYDQDKIYQMIRE